MTLVFLGDIASPDEKCSQDLKASLDKVRHIFDGNHTVLNMEGLISEINTSTNTPVLFNHPSIVPVLNDIGCRAVSLANNHTLDLPDEFTKTKEHLLENSILSCGAGIYPLEAAKPVRFMAEDREIAVFGFCWDVLTQHQKNQPGVCCVNPLKPKTMFESVRRERANNPHSMIVLKTHWSFDLETLPFPMYRKLSKDLIDAGANAVIGCHSHCVQGGERHNNGIIVYGLGNFFIPWHTFIKGSIHFPDFARRELALEWDYRTGDANCHWFEYRNMDGQHRLEYQGSEEFKSCGRLADVSPYADMDMDTYIPWFRENRRKSKLVPVYEDHRHSVRNFTKDQYLKARIRFARFLARTGLREWNN